MVTVRVSFLCYILFFMVMVLIPPFAIAQECPSPERHRISTRVPLMRNMINPNPLDYDFELPTPCGGSLVFRIVCVPSAEYFDDLEFRAGCDNCGRKLEGYMEERRPANIAGSFTRDNLPNSWQLLVDQMAEQEEAFSKIVAQHPQMPIFYFVSKYEITNFHWDAVMENECPGWDRLFNKEDPRPKTNISWFDAIEFTRRLNEWLLKNHPDMLPVFSDGRYAFVRLPTENEWEYAARGGHLVPIDRMNQEALFPLEGKQLTDYAVYTEVNSPAIPESVAWIGTKCSNPLGLFDTAGNASEMIFEPFRFSLKSGLHGSAGGFLIKGGSYRKSSYEIMPARREEMPYFLETDAYRSNEVGFRVVLAGIITSRDRLLYLKEQWSNYLTQNALKKELKNWTAADENTEQSALVEKLRIREVIWKALFTLESIIKYYSRATNTKDELKAIENLVQSSLPESEINIIKKRQNELSQQVSISLSAIDELFQSYLQTVLIIKAFPIDIRNEQFNIIGKKGDGLQSDPLSLAHRLSLVKSHATILSVDSTGDQLQHIFDEITSQRY